MSSTFVLLGVFILCICAGIPIAAGLGVSAVAALLVDGLPLYMIAQRMMTQINTFTVMAILFFMLSGEIMCKGTMTEKLVNWAQTLVGHIAGGLAIAAGVDMVLPDFFLSYRECHDALMEAYRKGVFSEERLNDAVRHVLAAQKRTMAAPTQTELTEKQKAFADELSAKSLCAILKEGVEAKLNPDTKKLFVLLHETNPSKSVSLELDDHRGYLKSQVESKARLIREAFPDAEIMLLNEFPNNAENIKVLSACAEADEVIFFTFCTSTNHQGSNNLTQRMQSVLKACMYKMAAIVHMGNPYEMRPFLDAPRIFLGLIGSDSERYAIKALKGEFIPTGKAPTDL